MTDAERAILTRLRTVDHELFQGEGFPDQLTVLQGMATRGWVSIETWPPTRKAGRTLRRYRMAAARITPRGRHALDLLGQGR